MPLSSAGEHAASLTRAWTASTSTSSGVSASSARTEHRLDHREVPSLLGDRAQELRTVGFERLDHRHVVVEDPHDRREWEARRLQLLDLQAAGELGGAVVPVSGAGVDVGRPEQSRPTRSAAAPAGRPATGGPERRSSSARGSRLGVSAAEHREPGAVAAFQRHPLDDVDDGAVGIDDHEVPLAELDGEWNDDVEPELIGTRGDRPRIVDLERDQDPASVDAPPSMARSRGRTARTRRASPRRCRARRTSLGRRRRRGRAAPDTNATDTATSSTHRSGNEPVTIASPAPRGSRASACTLAYDATAESSRRSSPDQPDSNGM